VSALDVCELDGAPRFSFRGCLAGARPVAGGLGAGGLKLLACSWFALGVGGLGLLPSDSGAHPSAQTQIVVDSPRADARGRTTSRASAFAPQAPAPGRREAVEAGRANPATGAATVDVADSPAAPAAPETANAPKPTTAPSAVGSPPEPAPVSNVLDAADPVVPAIEPPATVPPLPVQLPVPDPIPVVTAVTEQVGLP
jgi:hypothetical protein